MCVKMYDGYLAPSVFRQDSSPTNKHHFSVINISQGSVATHLMCGGIVMSSIIFTAVTGVYNVSIL